MSVCFQTVVRHGIYTRSQGKKKKKVLWKGAELDLGSI